MHHSLPCCVCFVPVVAAFGAEPASLQQLQAVAESVRTSLVRVEYTLQYADGEAPLASGWTARCPNCGEYHIVETDSDVRQERPTQAPGYLLAPRRVLAADPMVHPRFVKSIRVRFGGKTVGASIAAYASTENVLFLDLEAPLEGTVPLAFESASGPYLAVQHQFLDGAWTINVEPLALKFADAGGGRLFSPAPANSLITTSAGRPVAVSMSGELPADGSWKAAPPTWTQVSAADLASQLAALKKLTDRMLPRVSLSFRSPRTEGRAAMLSRQYGDEEEEATQRDVAGVVVGARRILVLAELKPAVTARLQQITVHPAEGEPIAATFLCTLKDHGALLAELERPVDTAAPLCTDDVAGFRRALLLAADLRIKGDNRRAYFQHTRIASFDRGWRGRLHPSLAGADSSQIFLFDGQRRLLAIPVTIRRKVAARNEYGYEQAILTPMSTFREVLDDPAGNSDPNNVPLDERSEARLAWLGVELQQMNKDLARANGVAHLTNDGETGALVAFVYPDSPADSAGIRQGDILLRLHVPGEPKPLDVQMEEGYSYFGSDFPWDQLDEIPEEYLSQLPRPWPSARNALTQALTELGFGRKFTAEFFRAGELLRKEFEVVRGPDHYDSAPRFKSEPIGLTVGDLTYEVRRYYQKAAADPGVIIVKAEAGGRAAVSKLRPYEIITHVNDTPVRSSDEFKALTAAGGELRLSAEGKTRKRIVRLRLPASQPATATAGGP